MAHSVHNYDVIHTFIKDSIGKAADQAATIGIVDDAVHFLAFGKWLE